MMDAEVARVVRNVCCCSDADLISLEEAVKEEKQKRVEAYSASVALFTGAESCNFVKSVSPDAIKKPETVAEAFARVFGGIAFEARGYRLSELLKCFEGGRVELNGREIMPETAMKLFRESALVSSSHGYWYFKNRVGKEL